MQHLTRRRTLALAALGVLTVAIPAWAAGPMAMLDPDHDGTVSLEEAKTAAGAMFDKLDTDHEGTLSAKELHGHLSASAVGMADPDNDKTLSKDEYLALVEKRFKAADPDNDGTLSAQELRTPAGRALLSLLH